MTISVKVTDDLAAKLDAWTKRQAAGLSRAEAIRQVAGIGLEIAEVARKRTGAESPMALELEGHETNRVVARQKERLTIGRRAKRT